MKTEVFKDILVILLRIFRSLGYSKNKMKLFIRIRAASESLSVLQDSLTKNPRFEKDKE